MHIPARPVRHPQVQALGVHVGGAHLSNAVSHCPRPVPRPSYTLTLPSEFGIITTLDELFDIRHCPRPISNLLTLILLPLLCIPSQ